MPDKTYENMLVGVLLFVGGLIAFAIIERYLKTGYILPPSQNLSQNIPLDVIPVVAEDGLEKEAPIDEDISASIKRQQPAGSLTTRSYTVTSAVKMLWSRRREGLQWTSFDAVNRGPDPIYISVNSSDWPDAGLPVGQTLNVDLKQRGAIDKVYLRCDQGKTAIVDLWVVK